MTAPVSGSNKSGAAIESAIEVFGAELKNQRETANISIEELFERTRINPTFLQAIEAGRFDQLPDAYTRLFLKHYALAVGLDADEVVGYYDKYQQRLTLKGAPSEEVPESPVRSKKRKWIAGFSALALALAVGLPLWFWLQPEPPPQTAQEHAIEPLLPLEPTRETRVVDAYSMPVDLPLSEAKTGLQLSGHAQAETWVWVWADGEPVFSSQLEAGEEISWHANRHFQVEIEYPAAVTLELSGLPLTMPVNPANRMRLYLSRSNIWAEARMLLSGNGLSDEQ